MDSPLHEYKNLPDAPWSNGTRLSIIARICERKRVLLIAACPTVASASVVYSPLVVPYVPGDFLPVGKQLP